MAKPKQDRGKLVSMDIVKNKCKDCGTEYPATKMVYENSEVITPPRCPTCQTAHLTDLRVSKTIKDFELLGNLKSRLVDVQRAAIIDTLTTEFNSLLDRYSGSTVKSKAFHLKDVKV